LLLLLLLPSLLLLLLLLTFPHTQCTGKLKSELFFKMQSAQQEQGLMGEHGEHVVEAAAAPDPGSPVGAGPDNPTTRKPGALRAFGLTGFRASGSLAGDFRMEFEESDIAAEESDISDDGEEAQEAAAAPVGSEGEGGDEADVESAKKYPKMDDSRVEELLARRVGLYQTRQSMESSAQFARERFTKRQLDRVVARHCEWAKIQNLKVNGHHGAFVDIQASIQWLEDLNTEQGLWRVPQEARYVLCPLVLDGRTCIGKNECLSCAFRQVFKPMSPAHSLDLFMIQGAEEFETIRPVDKQLHLTEQFQALSGKVCLFVVVFLQNLKIQFR